MSSEDFIEKWSVDRDKEYFIQDFLETVDAEFINWLLDDREIHFIDFIKEKINGK